MTDKLLISDTELNQITERIISAIEVHRWLGPGLLESAYKACLQYEMAEQGLRVESELPLPVVYKGVHLDCGYRLDFLVERTVIIELKAVDDLTPIHEAELLSYPKLSGRPIGLLINFNVNGRNAQMRLTTENTESTEREIRRDKECARQIMR